MTPRRVTLISGDHAWDVIAAGDGRIELEGRTYEVTLGPSSAALISTFCFIPFE